VLVSVCREDSYGSDALERCRILPYLIKAAPLRSAAPGRARARLRPWGADPSRRAGQPGSSHLLARSIGSIRTHGGSGHPDRAFRCPDLSTADGLAISLRGVGGYPGALAAASNLATIVLHRGEYQAARELGEDTLARRRRVLGEDHPDTGASAAFAFFLRTPRPLLKAISWHSRRRRAG
jgi:hypothetical protein